MTGVQIQNGMCLRPFVTLRTGGPADCFCRVCSSEDLAEAFDWGVNNGLPITLLGSGSNVLPSDDGVQGLVIVNRASRIEVSSDGTVEAETGCLLQDLFLKAAQSGLSGLEFAVGIPGTLGGALASNAGAYRSNISEHIVELEICDGEGVRRVPRDWMGFSYRHSKLRESGNPPFAVTRVWFKLPVGDRRIIFARAKDFQCQRILKQPPPASAGSFFKNVYSEILARSLPNLPVAMKEAGVVPAGYLIEACGLKGYRHFGAQISSRHANFILNVRNATSAEIRELATIAKLHVQRRFGVELEEEVLYIGRWQ